MTNSKKITDSTVTSVTAIDDAALVAVFDPASGKISKTDFATLKKAVRDSIQIGGRNLIKNSKTVEVKAGSFTHKFFYLPLTVEVKAGDELTISVKDIEVTSGTASTFAAYIRKGEIGDWGMLGADAHLTQSKKVATVTINSDYDNPYLLLYAGVAGLTQGNTVIYHYIKVERGNVATDWTPAPEDLNWGGVIYCLSTCCDSSQSSVYRSQSEKGGQHDRNETAYQRTSEGEDDRCDGFSGSYSKYRRTSANWSLLDNGRIGLGCTAVAAWTTLEVLDRRSVLPIGHYVPTTHLPNRTSCADDFCNRRSWRVGLQSLAKRVTARREVAA